MILARNALATTLTAIALILGVGLMGFSSMQPSHGAPVRPPRSKEKTDESKGDEMFPDGTVHDFGKAPLGTELKHAFRIVNTSEFPIQILGVNSSMNPIRAWSTHGELQPGEQTRLETIVDTNRFVGSRTMTLYLLMNHGGKPKEVRFWLKADSQK